MTKCTLCPFGSHQTRRKVLTCCRAAVALILSPFTVWCLQPKTCSSLAVLPRTCDAGTKRKAGTEDTRASDFQRDCCEVRVRRGLLVTFAGTAYAICLTDEQHLACTCNVPDVIADVHYPGTTSLAW